MAQVHLIDERAAVELLAAVVKQARNDVVRGHVAQSHRVSAWQLFLSIAEQRNYVDRPAERDTRGAGPGATGSGAFRLSTGRGDPRPGTF